MGDIPIHAKPDMHSGSHTDVGRESGEQCIAAASVLVDTGYAVVLRVEPSQHRANEPLTGHVPRFVRAVRQPEA